MVARFGGLHDIAIGGFATPTQVDPLAVARLGDLLPQVLERYGYASLPPVAEMRRSLQRRPVDLTPETNRPGVAKERRRIG